MEHNCEQECNQCGVFRFRIKSNYLAHYRQCRGRVLFTRRVEKETSYTTKMKNSDNKEESKKVMTINAAEIKKTYKCYKCDYKSLQNDDVKQHVSSNHQKMFECDRCGFYTEVLSKSSRNYHTLNCDKLKKKLYAYF